MLQLLQFVVADVALGSRLLLDFVLGEVTGVGLDVALGGRLSGRRDSARAAHERRVELVDLAGGVVERAGQVGAHRLARRSRGFATAGACGAALAALLRTFAVTGH